MKAAVISIALAWSVCTGAIAQEQRTDKPVTGNDREFVVKAAQDGLAEIAIAELAQKGASGDDVKNFARRMIADHGKSSKELETVAAKLGLILPKNPGEKQVGDMKHFTGLTAAAFDRDYSRHMVEAHEAAVTLFEKQAKGGDSPELRAYAEKTLPVLREHLKLARALAKARS